MTTTCRAAVMPAPNAPIEIRELPVPGLEPGGALLRTLYSEVCGTDVHLHHGKLAGVPIPSSRGTSPWARWPGREAPSAP